MQACFVKQPLNNFVWELVKRVKIESKGTAEQSGVLGNHSDFISKRPQVDFADVNSIDQNGAAFQFDNPRQGECDGWFTCTCPATNSNFFARTNIKTKFVQNNLSVWPVSKLYVFKSNLAQGWPLLIHLDLLAFNLLGNLL